MSRSDNNTWQEIVEGYLAAMYEDRRKGSVRSKHGPITRFMERHGTNAFNHLKTAWNEEHEPYPPPAPSQWEILEQSDDRLLVKVVSEADDDGFAINGTPNWPTVIVMVRQQDRWWIDDLLTPCIGCRPSRVEPGQCFHCSGTGEHINLSSNWCWTMVMSSSSDPESRMVACVNCDGSGHCRHCADELLPGWTGTSTDRERRQPPAHLPKRRTSPSGTGPDPMLIRQSGFPSNTDINSWQFVLQECLAAMYEDDRRDREQPMASVSQEFLDRHGTAALNQARMSSPCLGDYELYPPPDPSQWTVLEQSDARVLVQVVADPDQEFSINHTPHWPTVFVLVRRHERWWIDDLQHPCVHCTVTSNRSVGECFFCSGTGVHLGLKQSWFWTILDWLLSDTDEQKGPCSYCDGTGQCRVCADGLVPGWNPAYRPIAEEFQSADSS